MNCSLRLRVMTATTAVIAFFAVACPANASTKFLECTQANKAGLVQLIFAALDDDSEKAEVKLFAITAECAKDDSCGTDIYDKVRLPTVLRLTFSSIVDKVAYQAVIDIDRTNLNVITRTSLKTPIGNSETEFVGKCEVKRVEDSKKLL